MDLEGLNDDELARLWAEVMLELRERGLTRTSNNPVADLAERAAADELGLSLEDKSHKGYDAIDEEGNRYEVKSRRVTSWNNSRQLSPMRELEEKHFDYLVAVIYDQWLELQEMWKIPVDHVIEVASYRKHVNGYIAHAKGELLQPPAQKIM